MGAARNLLTVAAIPIAYALPRLLGADAAHAADFGGGLLQLAGLAVVVYGLAGRRRYATGRGILEEWAARMRARLPRWLRGKRALSQTLTPEAINVGHRVMRVSLTRTDLTDSLEDRIIALEQEHAELKSQVEQFQTDTNERLAKHYEAMGAEQRERTAADHAIRTELREQARKGLHVEAMGVVWVFAGIVLQTWADWLAPILTRWGL